MKYIRRFGNSEIKESLDDMYLEVKNMKNDVDAYMWHITDFYQSTSDDDSYKIIDSDNYYFMYVNISHEESEKITFLDKLLRVFEVIYKEFNLTHHTYTWILDNKYYYSIYLYKRPVDRDLGVVRRIKRFGPGTLQTINI